MKNFFYNILGLFLILCIVVVVITWIGMIYVGISELYIQNPNTLFIIIPFIIFVHWFGYICFKNGGQYL